MKCFVVGAESITYHPKDEDGVRLKNVNKSALSLKFVCTSLSCKGLSIFDKFIDQDDNLYAIVFENMGSSLSDLLWWEVNIDRNEKGYIISFEPVKHHDSILDITTVFPLISPKK